MQITIKPQKFPVKELRLPASKSHTIRRILIASLAEGLSVIDFPLDSLDTRSCVSVCRTLGAAIDDTDTSRFIVNGRGKNFEHKSPLSCDVGNSGTTLYLCLAAAALGNISVEFDGDEQIRRRSAAPLLNALKCFGIEVKSSSGDCAPITVKGPWKGGRASIECTTSQYLSPLLIAAPLAPEGTITEIDVPLLNEKPYIDMTLSYLINQNIPFETNEDYSYFRIPGGCEYKPINGPVPGDFSSAAFPAAAALIGGVGPEGFTLLGLDMLDTQGDKVFFSHLEKMGCKAETNTGKIIVSGAKPFSPGEFDLNATPDMLPVLAIMACYAQGETRLFNAAHARIKETDRIAVMAMELGKLGVHVEEKADGLIIHGKGELNGGKVDSHGDHRIAMAFAAAALSANEPIEIEGAESAAVSYPGFLELMNR